MAAVSHVEFESAGQINSSGDVALYRFLHFRLKLPIHAPFGSFFLGGHISLYDVTYRPGPQKDRPWAETRRLSHQRKNRCNGSSWARYEESP